MNTCHFLSVFYYPLIRFRAGITLIALVILSRGDIARAQSTEPPAAASPTTQPESSTQAPTEQQRRIFGGAKTVCIENADKDKSVYDYSEACQIVDETRRYTIVMDKAQADLIVTVCVYPGADLQEYTGGVMVATAFSAHGWIRFSAKNSQSYERKIDTATNHYAPPTVEVIGHTPVPSGGNNFGWSGLRWQDTLRLMLYSVDPNQSAWTAQIRSAAASGDLENVRACLKHNPGLVFCEDEWGRTPLQLAAAAGHKDVAELLLDNKADVNARHNDGATPLHKAAAAGYEDVAKLLLNNKADVNARDNDGATPLLKAAAAGHRDVVELLLDNKADVNARENDNGTPLLKAAAAGHKDIVELLLDNKADVNAADGFGETPLWWADHYDHDDVVQLLKQHGGH